MNSQKEKLPQNIQNLVMEIGEKSVLFRLYILTQGTSWNVFYNLCDVGCDIVILNYCNNDKIKVEVKTRQRLYTTSLKHQNVTHFTITELERNSSDFFICFWFEENAYFIVPKEALKAVKSNENTVYKFIVRKTSNGEFDSNSNIYLNNWSQIQNRLNSQPTYDIENNPSN